MITLTKMLGRGGRSNTGQSTRRASVRDKLLIGEVREMGLELPPTCKTCFDDENKLHEFTLTVAPDEGFWKDGHFNFNIYVPEEYNMAPPKVKCLTKLWHPNISVDGEICLSLLRQSSIDGLGWAPTRRLKDVVWGLNSLFTDLLNFEDPLNIDAAEMYLRDKEAFRIKAKEYVNNYASR